MYKLEDICKMTFENNNQPIDLIETNEKSFYELTGKQLFNMPTGGRDKDTLRIRLSELFHERFENYADFETRCDISRENFTKILRFKNGREMTFKNLTKFIIGSNCSLEEAKELLLLYGYNFEPNKNKYDYIIACELQNKTEICEVSNDLIKNGFDGLISKSK